MFSLLIEEFLQTWLQQTPSIPLLPIDTNEDGSYKSRSIIIPVDVPSVSVVHTADLKLLETSPVVESTFVAASNQPISASLTIKWTRIWDTDPPTTKGTASEDELEFFYEVSGAADTWLIGGRRKGHFRIPSKSSSQSNKKKLTFPVVLIPLKEGFLPFPNVDIKPVPVAKVDNPAQESSTEIKGVASCETDYRNAGETIRVISDARKTTVSLDASGPQGGAWLLESERRMGKEEGMSLG